MMLMKCLLLLLATIGMFTMFVQSANPLAELAAELLPEDLRSGLLFLDCAEEYEEEKTITENYQHVKVVIA
ncbi:unnamed protein product [Schistosoma turkestanicum]|nr:unnamed protein product [Schistosoma turkestanicum]